MYDLHATFISFVAQMYGKGKPDYQRFVDLLCSALFYEQMADWSGSAAMDRGKFKKAFMIQCVTGKHIAGPIWRALCRHFPDLAGFVAMKRVELGRHVFSCELMKLESALFLRSIPNALCVAIPGINLATVHDAILFPVRYAHEVHAIVSRVVEDTLGFPAITTPCLAIGSGEKTPIRPH